MSESSHSRQNPLELLVIGAGPHALSLLTRLIDDEPDLMTEFERGYILQKASRLRPHSEVQTHLKKNFVGTEAHQRILKTTAVIDSRGSWMAQWKFDFSAFDIKHLRSHEHMHPDPFDFQALSVWARMQKRDSELRMMTHVDRDACRRAGYRAPWVTPSTKLFLDFCSTLAERYGLGGVVRQGTVADVRIICEKSGDHIKSHELRDDDKIFEVILADGQRLFAKRVVCAMGPGPAFQGMRATLPWWAEELEAALADDNHSSESASSSNASGLK
eukprot:gene921-1130_t